MTTALVLVATAMALVGTAQVAALVLVRGWRRLGASPAAQREQRARDLLYGVLMGDEEESREALAGARARRGRDWDALEDQALRLLAKVRGESHAELVALLVERGAEDRALRLARSRSSARRCRGAHRLGVLSSRRGIPRLVGLLTDSQFLVRRVAVRALGRCGAADTTSALVDAVLADPSLRGDALGAVSRIGHGAAATLVDRVRNRAAHGSDHIAVSFAAAGLGVLDTVEAGDVLAELLCDPAADPSVRVAAAEALGRIGAPGSVPALVDALGAVDPFLVQEAARALGRVGDPAAAARLGLVLAGGGHGTARAAARALLSLGRAGMDELHASGSAYAREALSAHELTAGV